jgi:hypothetical protein
MTAGACGTVTGAPAVAANTAIKVTPPAGPTQCTAQVSGPPSVGMSGELCTGASAGNTCTRQGGGVGVCAPPGNFNGPGACTMGPSNQSCPIGYPQQYLVADSLTDSRTCGAAACGTTSCAAGTLHLYGAANCSGGSSLRQATDGTCATSTNSAFTAIGYEISPASGCNLQIPATVNGGAISYGPNPQTVCCTGGNWPGAARACSQRAHSDERRLP